MSKHEFFARRDENDSSDSTEFLHASSDGSSNEDKLVAQSVQGEDDMVDITMRDTNDSKASPDVEIKREYVIPARRPNWPAPQY